MKFRGKKNLNEPNAKILNSYVFEIHKNNY